MRWASALSEAEETAAAITAAAAEVAQQLAGERADLVVVFASPHHAGSYEAVPAAVAAHFPHALLVGCSAAGVIGAGREIEARPALSLTAARLPGVQLSLVPLPLLPDDLGQSAMRRRLGRMGVGEDPHFIVLADPFTCDADALLSGLDAAFPGGQRVGGLVSGGANAGDNVLYAGQQVQHAGAVLVAMCGDIAIDTIVSQGCRPVGAPLLITRAEGHIIYELDGKSPADVLRALYDGLDERDRELFRSSLFVGLEMDEGAIEYRAGKLLVRHIGGIEPRRGALAVAARVRPWQVMQFLLRDARTAERDLLALLDGYAAEGSEVAGALLFSCLERGESLFGRPDHDSELFRARVGAVPLGGFFCNGEIGSVGGQTFLHGSTSAFGLFRHK